MAQSAFRKAIGTVKDHTSISLLKVSTNLSPELDIAIVRATSHNRDPPDEGQVREILRLASLSRAHARECALSISRRLTRTRDWIVALKSLALVHRLLTDGDPSLRAQFLLVPIISEFRDEAHSCSWDYSVFVRAYALYLDQRLGFVPSSLQGATLEKLLQRVRLLRLLLGRILCCRPTGLAKNERMVILALSQILRESFGVYGHLCEILSLLLNTFFDMGYADCVKTLDAYAAAAKQIDELAPFYAWCKTAAVACPSEFPQVKRTCSEVMGMLEEFVREKGERRAFVKVIPALKALPPPQSDHGEDDFQVKELTLFTGEKDEQSKIVKEAALKEEDKQPDLIDLRGDDNDDLQAEEQKSADHPDLVDLRDGDFEAKEAALSLVPTDRWEVFPGSESGEADWEVALVECAGNIEKEKAAFGEGFDPFAASLSFPPASYMQMADIDGKQQLPPLEGQQMWKLYAEQGKSSACYYG